ncbi:MAG: GNAT family N-acetyltransferase [Pseudomonadota bacterium]
MSSDKPAPLDGAPQAGIRDFDLAKDLDAVKRIWREVGWVEEDEEVQQLDYFFACGSTLLGTLDDVPECSVHIAPGDLYLGDTALPLCAVTAVTTSRIARGHAFAQRLTAAQLARGAGQGAAVAALGIFDQGFYDKLGFGTSAYDHSFILDPATLRIAERPRTPVRLTAADYADVHQAMSGRNKVNGSVVLHPPELMRAELGFEQKSFGLGYRQDGRLTHFVWLAPKGERGPYRVVMLGYERTDQLLELLALLKSLADQVYSVQIMEPPEVQLQALLDRPFRNAQLSEKGEHAAEHKSFAWWQLRILDVATCVSALRGLPQSLTLQLEVTDPVSKWLPEDARWRGIEGQYVVQLGDTCTAEVGFDAQLPRLQCSVNTLTRLLWCVRPASSLAVTDDLRGAPELLQQLDAILRLSPPVAGWEF